MSMACDGSLLCLHGTCVTKQINTTTRDVCECQPLYSSTQCAFRNGILYFELPLAIVILIGFCTISVRVSAHVLELLRFAEATDDEFAFPRTLVNVSNRTKHEQDEDGEQEDDADDAIEANTSKFTRFCALYTWEGPSEKGFPWRKHHWTTRILLFGIVLPLELLPFMQMAAVNFFPLFPWPSKARIVRHAFQFVLFQPFWTHGRPQDVPWHWFYGALAFVPLALVVIGITGLRRFPLFKPQPTTAPAEDICSLLLRLTSEWALIPVLLSHLLPLECLFDGYTTNGALFVIPVYEETCFTLVNGGHMVLGFSMSIVYLYLTSAILLQLNCERSFPQPTFWTDVRFMRCVHAIRATAAMSVVAFGQGNAFMLSFTGILSGIVLSIAIVWMKPCLYSLVNNLRLLGALTTFWSGLMGFWTAVRDDPTDESLYEVWSLGMITITAISISSMVVYHVEASWFHTSKASDSKPVSKPLYLFQVHKGDEDAAPASRGAAKRQSKQLQRLHRAQLQAI